MEALLRRGLTRRFPPCDSRVRSRGDPRVLVAAGLALACKKSWHPQRALGVDSVEKLSRR